jgi:uncharacterized Zn finger protein
MATRTSYGQTWWGAQWLNALSRIDYANRLPRGRTYANKGAVTQIDIRHGKIRAKVTGSRPRPYDVRIDVPAMPPKQAKELLDALAQEPVIIARMLNRELDPAVPERAQSLGISVFPEQWQDLSMHCSCPDWAVPCKHLAAVIYLVSREIDGNPFMVFALKGVDLPNELKRLYEPVIYGAPEPKRWPVMIQSLGQLAEADLPDLQPEVAALPRQNDQLASFGARRRVASSVLYGPGTGCYPVATRDA